MQLAAVQPTPTRWPTFTPLAAAPIADPKAARARQRTVLQGELPSPIDLPAGCPFHSRCPIAQDRCKLDKPLLRPVGDGALAACHFV